MKKLFIISCGVAAMVFFSSLLFISCKKKINPAHPSPDNSRLLSYTKFITPIIGTPVNQTFRFYYDEKGRLSQIAYTSNDSLELVNSTAQRVMNFVYVNDSIFKTTKTVPGGVVLEVDTFKQNLTTKQITEVYMPGYRAFFEYHNKLIYGKREFYFDTYGEPSVTIEKYSTYTSDNGDILSHVFNGNLTAMYKGLTPPIATSWQSDLRTELHATVAGLTDQLTNAYAYTTTTGAMDINGIQVGPFQIVDPTWQREEHRVYPDLLNRPGDIYQLESFTKFGVNIYANEHLTRQIIGTGPAVPGLLNIQYTIDADSKITQTYVSGYGYTTNTSVIYKMQYETF